MIVMLIRKCFLRITKPCNEACPVRNVPICKRAWVCGVQRSEPESELGAVDPAGARRRLIRVDALRRPTALGI